MTFAWSWSCPVCRHVTPHRTNPDPADDGRCTGCLACPVAGDQLELLAPDESRALLDTFDSLPPETELRALWGDR